MEEEKSKDEQGKINLEEMIVKEVDRSIEMKGKIESKAASYMVGVTLMLGILLEYIAAMKTQTLCPQFEILCKLCFVASFAIGAVLLLLFAYTLLPRPSKYFDADWLIKLQADGTKTSADNDKKIIEKCKNFVSVNDSTMYKLARYSIYISRGLLVLTSLFIFDSILFFIFFL